MARIKKCDGIICGHIHQPALKEMDGVLYMNSGDWVESLTALVETLEGEWKIVSFEDKLIDDAQPEEEEEEENSSYIEDLMVLREELKLRKSSHKAS
jgi:predicted phosphodiesterase